MADLTHTVMDAAEQIAFACGDKAARDSIAAMIEYEGAKRHGRGVKRLALILAEAVRNRFDQPDPPAPEGRRARYNEDEGDAQSGEGAHG